MALTIGDNFSFRARKPLDARILVTSIANLLAIPNSTIYDGIIVYVASDKKFYTYDSNNTVDPTLQQWRELKTASYTIKTATIDNVSTSPTYNHLILTLDDDPTNPTKIDCGDAKGDKGDKGDGFAIIKLYTNVSDMTSDASPVNDGQMVAVIDNTTSPITAKVYIRNSAQTQDASGNENGYTFFCNLADATVIQGPQGPQGQKGDKGDTPVITTQAIAATSTMPSGTKITFTTGTGSTATSTSINVYNGKDGVSVSSATINASGELVFTLSDASTINVGKIGGNGTGGCITMLGCFDTAPTTFVQNDIYYNNLDGLIYKSPDGTTWGTGTQPEKDILYISMDDHKIYSYTNNTFEVYGGGIIDISSKSNNAIKNITGSINPTEDGLYVEDLSTIVNSISLSQKTVNSDLDYCFVGFWNTTNSNVIVTCARGAAIPFNTKFEGNLEFNSTNKAIKLKAGHRYKLHYQCKQTGTTANDNHMERFYNETTSEWLKMTCNCDTNDETHTMEEIYVPTVDCEVSVRNCWCPVTSFSMRVNCINTDVAGPGLRKIDCESAFIVTEIGKTVTVDPVAYLSKDGNLEETPVGSVISYMGTSTPAHYLPCDGTVYNIADYPELALHIKNEFGAYDYFGGDGVTTFAVPDKNIKTYSSIITPATSATGSDYTIISSGEHSLGTLNAWKAFDNNLSTNYTSNRASPSYIGIVFNKTKEINCYKLVSRNFDNNDIRVFPNEFILQGTNDGTTWVDIDTQKGVSVSSKKEEVMFTLPRAVSYKGYRLYMTKNNGYSEPYFGLSEFNLYKVKEYSIIKYETTHKIFFGDQTTYKVSVPITYNFPQTPRIVWAEFDTANAEDDISMLGSSSITSQGDAFVAPMDGYYLATFMFPEQADIPGTRVTYHSTYVYKNGIVIGGSNRQDNSTNIRVLLNESFTLKLKKGDTINVGVYMSGQTAAFTRNGQATFCLVNTLNENKTAELMNKPNTWVVGQEYDFGNDLYGQRFIGSVTPAAANKAKEILLTSTIYSNIIESGGMWNRGKGKFSLPIGGISSTTGSIELMSSIYIKNNVGGTTSGLYAVFLDNGVSTTTYDIWVKYTK